MTLDPISLICDADAATVVAQTQTPARAIWTLPDVLRWYETVEA